MTHLEECVTSIQKMDTEIDLKDKENLAALATIEYFKSELIAIENSIELYLNEENMYCYDLQDQIKKDCEKLDDKLTEAKDYRKNHPLQKVAGPVKKAPSVKTDGPGIEGDRIMIANNEKLMKKYIEYSKEEWNSFPSRVRAYIDKFNNKDSAKK